MITLSKYYITRKTYTHTHKHTYISKKIVSKMCTKKNTVWQGKKLKNYPKQTIGYFFPKYYND